MIPEETDLEFSNNYGTNKQPKSNIINIVNNLPLKLNSSYNKRIVQEKINYSIDDSILSNMENGKSFNMNDSINYDYSNLDIENELNESKIKYLSINSNSILQASDSQTAGHEFDNNAALYLLEKNNYTFFYFEINYLIIWAKDYLQCLYPNLNLVLLIEINDDVRSSEKILLCRGQEDKYYPLIKKDEKNKVLRFSKTVLSSNNPEGIHKISFLIYTYFNNKMLSICEDEIYVSNNYDEEIVKFKFYLNTNMKYYNKKIGNLYFNLAYKTEELHDKDLQDYNNKILNTFTTNLKTTKFNEDHLLIFKYNHIPNCFIKNNGSKEKKELNSTNFNVINNNLNGKYSPKNNSKFDSIGDVQVKLKGENISLSRIIEMMDLVKYSYDLYVLLKKIFNFVNSGEFTEDIIFFTKEKILKKVNDLLEMFSENTNDIKKDRFIIPAIFNLLRKIIFKPRSVGRSKKRIENYSIGLDDNEKVKIKNKMNLTFFEKSFNFFESSLSAEVSLSALNYINKHFDEFIPNFVIEGNKKYNSDEYATLYIIKNKTYKDFYRLLEKYYNLQSCVHPIISILSKIIKQRKEDGKEIIGYLIQRPNYKDIVKKIILSHDCNNFILTNILTIFYYMIEVMKVDMDTLFSVINFTKLREIFCTFKLNGFDQLHEAVLYIIKSILIRKSDKTTKEENKNTLNDNDFVEIITIFSHGLDFIRYKIFISDTNKIAKSLMSQLNYIYIITNIINNSYNRNVQICRDKKISENLIEIFYTLNEKNIFSSLDMLFDKHDANRINTMAMLFRTIFHCLSLVKNLKDCLETSLVISYYIKPKSSAEKLYKVIKIIDDNDSSYCPDTMLNDIRKVKKLLLQMKNIDAQKSLLSSLNNLKEFYTRYKSKIQDYKNELLKVIRK